MRRLGWLFAIIAVVPAFLDAGPIYGVILFDSSGARPSVLLAPGRLRPPGPRWTTAPIVFPCPGRAGVPSRLPAAVSQARLAPMSSPCKTRRNTILW
jgi:hypothetical protein